MFENRTFRRIRLNTDHPNIAIFTDLFFSKLQFSRHQTYTILVHPRGVSHPPDPMKPAARREALVIKHRNHDSEYYIAPMLEKGLIERTNPGHPQSP